MKTPACHSVPNTVDCTPENCEPRQTSLLQVAYGQIFDHRDEERKINVKRHFPKLFQCTVSLMSTTDSQG